jgi:hypothetical protein
VSCLFSEQLRFIFPLFLIYLSAQVCNITKKMLANVNLAFISFVAGFGEGIF